MYVYFNTEINRNTQKIKIIAHQRQYYSTITKNLERQLSDTVRFNMPQLIHSEGDTGKRDDSISSVNAIPKSGKLKQYLEVPKYENIPIEHGMKSKIAISGQYHTMLTQSDTMLFNALKQTLHMGLWGDTYKKIADKIVNHLKTGNGKDFNDTIELSTLMLSQQSFKLLIKEISTAFRQKMAISTYDFTLIYSLKENQKKRSDLKNFPFGISYNDSTALKVLVGGVQQLDVILKDIHYQFNKLHHRNDFKYRAEFEITIYDQFGINESDISNASFTASLGMQGLIAFWILQRQRGYKPFRTAFKFNHIINDKF